MASTSTNCFIHLYDTNIIPIIDPTGCGLLNSFLSISNPQLSLQLSFKCARSSSLYPRYLGEILVFTKSFKSGGSKSCAHKLGTTAKPTQSPTLGDPAQGKHFLAETSVPLDVLLWHRSRWISKDCLYQLDCLTPVDLENHRFLDLHWDSWTSRSFSIYSKKAQ